MNRPTSLKTLGLAAVLTAGLMTTLVGCQDRNTNTAPTDGGGLNQHGEIEGGSTAKPMNSPARGNGGSGM